MSWPQWCVAALLVMQLIGLVRKETANREQSSGMATFGIFIGAGMLAGFAALLHAGGFW